MTDRKAFFPYIILALALTALAVIVFSLKFFQAKSQQAQQFMPPPAPVTTTYVETQQWSTTLTALGTVSSDEGITIAAEVAGRVESIHFRSGDKVETGALLLQQDSGNEIAQLEAANAQLSLAESTFERTKKLRTQGTVSLSQYDQAQQELLSARAQVQNLRSTLQKKSIKAPFAGTLGIRRVDLGQDLLVGDHIVDLQAHDKLTVNFNLPQRSFDVLEAGLSVEVNLLETKEPVISGEVNAIGAIVDEVTRSIEVQATLANAGGALVPGMAVDVRVQLPDVSTQLVVPATAVVYAPFGDTVYVIEQDKESEQLKVRQQFVKIAERRGDFVSIAAGLEEGEHIVSVGAFKLFNGQAVAISEQPGLDFSLNPEPADG